MSLIDRGKVMSDYLENLGRTDSYKAKYEALVKAIDDAPTVDAEPVRHGRWLKDAELNTYCSCCDGYIPTVRCHQDYEDDEYDWDEEIEETEFCPNCGAKMDKEE